MARRSDADTGLRIHLLDMGREKYGDSILVQVGSKTALIDGGHPGDFRPRHGFPAIPDQLQDILGQTSPFRIDVLIVTHCHSDHIGCLPTLVKDGIIEVGTAIVADEGLGFGRGVDDSVPTSDDPTQRLAAALREEDHSDLPEDELLEFLQDAAKLEQRYIEMLTMLEDRHTRVVRYGRDDLRGVQRILRELGLEILGPTKDHLIICAEAITRFTDVARDALQNTVSSDDPRALADAYRAIVNQADTAAAFAEDRPGKGAALNDQSIVLKIRSGSASALLAGDMQFALAEVSGLDEHMRRLRATVKAAGPYHFVKLSHHSSYNGVDERLLDADLRATTAYGHTGGTNDATHPDHGVLQLLDERRNKLVWARTDRNGLTTISFDDERVIFDIARGDLSDATPNGDVISEAPEPAQPTAATSSTREPRRESESATEVTGIAKLGVGVRGVTMTFELLRDGTAAPPSAARPDRPTPRMARVPPPSASTSATSAALAGGQKLPKLLFVTYRQRLANNLGQQEAARCEQLIQSAGHTIHSVTNANTPFAEIRRELAAGYAGVVILGGYDVLPSQRLDVLPASLRQQVGATTADADNFIVWNDEVYGDRDGDGLPEVPVSRIPDAKSPKLVMAALGALRVTQPSRFGIRNEARPFAAGPYGLLPGGSPLLISQPTAPASVGSGKASAPLVYLMLHGSDADATRFWGENRGAMHEALNITNLPRTFAGAVMTGCCWGALTVQKLASQARPGDPVGVRTPGTSIALSYLHSGATAFIGCTGSHYSPTIPPYNYFGGPMHSAVFRRLVTGMAPAQALFEGKLEYLNGLPHGQTSAIAQAIEFKILRQFTCLGLGW